MKAKRSRNEGLGGIGLPAARQRCSLVRTVSNAPLRLLRTCMSLRRALNTGLSGSFKIGHPRQRGSRARTDGGEVYRVTLRRMTQSIDRRGLSLSSGEAAFILWSPLLRSCQPSRNTTSLFSASLTYEASLSEPASRVSGS